MSTPLSQFIAGRGLSRNEVARRLDHSNPGFVSLVFSGDRAVPLDKVREWADALKLDDKERPEFYDLCLDAQSAELAASVGELRRQVRGLSLIVAPPADAIAVAIDEWAENQDKTLLSKLLIRVLSANLRLAGYVEGHTADAKAVTSVLHQNWTASQIGDALAALGEQLQPPRPSSPKPRGSDPGSAGSAPGRR